MKTFIHRNLALAMLLVAGGSAMLFSSCGKDFLDIAPQGALTDNLFPKTADDALKATNAAYAGMHTWSYYTGGFPIIDIMSDDARKGSNPADGARLNLFDDFTYTPTASDLFPWYSAMYKVIRSANVVIEKVPEIEMDNTLKNRYIAEARFIRGMVYFNMTRAFGAVPMVTTVNPDSKMSRTDVATITSTVIIPDLEFAATTLPARGDYSSANAGRATKGAAQAFLAKVYLYQKNYAKAAEYAELVINSGDYALEPTMNKAFSLDGQFGSESVFELGARPFESLEQGGNQYANTQGVRGTPNRGWGFCRPAPSLLNDFEPGDLRKDATVIFLGETLDGVLIEGDKSTLDSTFDGSGNLLEIECYNQKVWVPGTGTIEPWGYNVRVMRYAEVLLIAAEAENELGNSATAEGYLNEVRHRAGLADVNGLSQSDMRTKIWHERRVELAMEGDRFFDLVRTGQAPTVLGPLGFVTGKHELMPIPQSEIDLSEGTLTQNPKW